MKFSKVAAMAAGTMIALGAAAAPAFADADAAGAAVHSPGVLSGNDVAVPVDIPVNLCGDTVDVIGLLNPAFGDSCADVSQG
ncbi:chaplin [Actinacidiphila acidipaludis]|uniref:Chaplin n=1 Tax=Actinacidiphila acidipaludis TaxID=2873382 RepID=A0ABS7Q342_9ACTN|nr:chaplin [Streptomyces acidipaludis]MBY8877568.1 chaplin [Streptomyces acidipaludis]